MINLRLLLSNSYNPWFNLSLEEYLFQNMSQNQSILFLWRNQNTVVIGRAQNAWKECNTRRMERDGIQLARRNSGGGAVFHDLGNTCFTFMSTHNQYNKHISFNIILNSLNDLGIKACLFGRNDLIINTDQGQRKISGSAYRELSDRKFHHGTLLLNVDLNKLTYYLNPDSKKLKTKGITSISSRVMNLSELKLNISHEDVCIKLKESFFEYYKNIVKTEIVSMENFFHVPEFLDLFNKQSYWGWNFGSAPLFSHYLDHRFTWGNVELHFDIEKGIISNCRIFTDSLDPIPLEDLSKKLIGILYKTNNIQNCCKKWMQFWSNTSELQEVSDWLIAKTL